MLRQDVNLGALTAGVTTLFAAVGLLAVDGLLGRVERNDPELLTAAVLCALLGSGMLLIAGLPITAGRSEIFAALLGAGLIVIGVAFGMAGAIRSAGERQRPAVQASIDDKGMLDAKVKASNIASDRRMAVHVEGLKPEVAGEAKADPVTLAAYYVGADADGNVDLPIKLKVPSEYAALGIKAWSDMNDTCEGYRLGPEETEVELATGEAGTGCLVIPIPAATTPATKPKPVAPLVRLEWLGGSASPQRARLTVTTPVAGGRIVVHATVWREGRSRELIRSVAPAAASGAFRSTSTLVVGADYRRVCAVAYIETSGRSRPRALRTCPVPASWRVGAHSADVLRRPAAARRAV